MLNRLDSGVSKSEGFYNRILVSGSRVGRLCLAFQAKDRALLTDILLLGLLGLMSIGISDESLIP